MGPFYIYFTTLGNCFGTTLQHMTLQFYWLRNSAVQTQSQPNQTLLLKYIQY